LREHPRHDARDFSAFRELLALEEAAALEHVDDSADRRLALTSIVDEEQGVLEGIRSASRTGHQTRVAPP
jgi:hypothetical protein